MQRAETRRRTFPGSSSWRDDRPSDLERAPPLEGTTEGDLVGVLEVAADRQPAREAGHPQTHRLDQPGEVGRRGFALEVGVGGQDQLRHGTVSQAGHQLTNPEVVRADSFDRRDRTAEHVVATAELAGALDSDDVLRLLDDTDDGRVAPWVAADAALLALRHVAAHDAEADLVLAFGECRYQPAYVAVFRGEQVERDALRALGPDAGQPAELVDEVLNRSFVHRVAVYRPGRPRPPPKPPVNGPIRSCASSPAARAASRTAATTRSWSVSTSSGSTAFGSMVSDTSSAEPVMVAVTSPPPALPVTSVSASSA